MNIDHLIKIIKENDIDAVHPGYGFLSESAEFSKRVHEETEGKTFVIGPGWEVLEMTGDKLAAKRLAQSVGVPVLQAMQTATNDPDDVHRFAKQVGLPIMVKAVDGGGGRGIRAVESEDVLQNAVERCISESPSGKVFAEQAVIRGYKHIEVQILGDGRGGVSHLWERDCSVQRRFQKIVEVAPSQVTDQERKTIDQAIEAACLMAANIHYLGLGTWEFLLSVQEQKFFFLEINPRLQVEHTVSEMIAGVDLVREQLLLGQALMGQFDQGSGRSLTGQERRPGPASIQLRLCAEDPNANFALSIGKVTEIQLPSGNGVRVDSHLSKGGTVGSNFDNLMAKIIVTAADWQQAISRAKRALADTRIVGVKTNLDLLRAVVEDEDFQSGKYDTKWLEDNLSQLIRKGSELGRTIEQSFSSLPQVSSTSASETSIGNAGVLFRKGDAWSLTLEDPKAQSGSAPPAHHLSIDRIVRNEFPEALVADIAYTIPGSKSQSYRATFASTTSSSESASSTHRRGDLNNKSHIVLPMSGKLVEILVKEGDEIAQGEVIAFVKQMKMELEIRSPRAGRIAWTIELENEAGDEVAEGVLLAELEDEAHGAAAQGEIRSKL